MVTHDQGGQMAQSYTSNLGLLGCWYQRLGRNCLWELAQMQNCPCSQMCGMEHLWWAQSPSALHPGRMSFRWGFVCLMNTAWGSLPRVSAPLLHGSHKILSKDWKGRPAVEWDGLLKKGCSYFSTESFELEFSVIYPGKYKEGSANLTTQKYIDSLICFNMCSVKGQLTESILLIYLLSGPIAFYVSLKEAPSSQHFYNFHSLRHTQLTSLKEHQIVCSGRLEQYQNHHQQQKSTL